MIWTSKNPLPILVKLKLYLGNFYLFQIIQHDEFTITICSRCHYEIIHFWDFRVLLIQNVTRFNARAKWLQNVSIPSITFQKILGSFKFTIFLHRLILLALQMHFLQLKQFYVIQRIFFIFIVGSLHPDDATSSFYSQVISYFIETINFLYPFQIML